MYSHSVLCCRTWTFQTVVVMKSSNKPVSSLVKKELAQSAERVRIAEMLQSMIMYHRA